MNLLLLPQRDRHEESFGMKEGGISLISPVNRQGYLQTFQHQVHPEIAFLPKKRTPSLFQNLPIPITICKHRVYQSPPVRKYLKF